MSVKINKDGKGYPIGVIPSDYPEVRKRDVSDLVTSNQSSGVYISATKNKNGTVTINVSANGIFVNGAIIISPNSSIAVPSSLYGKLLGMGTVMNTQDNYLNCVGSVSNGSFVIYYSAPDTAKVVQYSVTYPIA